MNRLSSTLICVVLAAASVTAFAQGSTGKKAASTPSFGQGSPAPKSTPSHVPTKGALAAKEKALHQQLALCSNKARTSGLKGGTPEHNQAVTKCLNG